MEIQDKKFYTNAALISLLIVAVVAGVFYWLVQNASQPTYSEENQPLSQNPTDKQSAGVLAVLRTNSNLAPAPLAIGTQVSVDESALPPDLQALLLPGRSNVSANSANFADTKTGYIIKYRLSSKISDTQKEYLAIDTKGWTAAGGVHNDYASLARLENDKYEVIVEQTVADAQNLDVNITVVEKPI